MRSVTSHQNKVHATCTTISNLMAICWHPQSHNTHRYCVFFCQQFCTLCKFQRYRRCLEGIRRSFDWGERAASKTTGFFVDPLSCLSIGRWCQHLDGHPFAAKGAAAAAGASEVRINTGRPNEYRTAIERSGFNKPDTVAMRGDNLSTDVCRFLGRDGRLFYHLYRFRSDPVVRSRE